MKKTHVETCVVTYLIVYEHYDFILVTQIFFRGAMNLKHSATVKVYPAAPEQGPGPDEMRSHPGKDLGR